jgi:hypothetical protein
VNSQYDDSNRSGGVQSTIKYALAIVLGVVVLALRLTRYRNRDHREDYSEPPVPTVTAHDAAVVPPAQPSQDLLATIRSQGYRVTVHQFVGALEMRASSASEPNRVIQSARVDRPSGSSDAEQRCARELAKKLGIEVPATP